MTQASQTATASRRAVLGSLATGVTALGSGCTRRMRTVAGWEGSTRVALDVKTVPPDSDPYALRVARQIADWLRAAGIDVQVTPMDEEELLRQVLVQHEFDLFVSRIPDRFRSPDTLYTLLHSQFAESAGWQNPFGYTNLDADDLLERQRQTTGEQRREAVAELQRTVARTQPFTVVAFPDDIRAARSDSYTNWRAGDLSSPLGYLRLDRADNRGDDDEEDDGGDDDRNELAMAVTDRRATENLNPLAVEFRRNGLATGLLYDSLGYGIEAGTVEPWMARSWAVSDGTSPRATVRLRTDLSWHDGEAVTADDVAFTYELLADTSLGANDGSDGEEGDDDPVPAPRFQGRTSLVSDVETVDTETVEFEFVDCDAGIATRAFTVPILPRHVWEDRAGGASVGGIEFGPATEALVTDNIPPVGSGPFQFVSNTPRESFVLERFEGHFLSPESDAEPPVGIDGPPGFDRLSARFVGSDTTAVEMVVDGDADVTGTPVGAGTVPRIGRANDLELVVDRANGPFVLGYNARRQPLVNPRFRNTLARLIDQDALVDEVFDHYARPGASPLTGTEWLPEDLRWDDGNPVTPFFGEAGELDVQRAREAFRAAGYQYENGNLVENT